MTRHRFIPALVAMTMTSAGFAQTRVPPAPLAYTQLADPAKEAEARALMETVRCLVCQGQSIADSDADMAGDMRALVRARIGGGGEGGFGARLADRTLRRLRIL